MIVTEAPWRGEIMVGGGIWRFRRHGAGVDFIRTSDNTRVDIQDKFASPDLFDLWRMELFLESRGALVRGRKLAELVSTLPEIKQANRHFYFLNDS